MYRLLLIIPLVLLGGCPQKVTPPPTPPPPSFSWTGTGNSDVTSLTHYTLTDTTNPIPVVIANIPIGQLAYVLASLPTTGTHTYTLTISGIGNGGQEVTSPGVSTKIVIP